MRSLRVFFEKKAVSIRAKKNNIHLDVMLLHGNIIEKLEGEAYTYFKYARRQKREKAVVVALAASKSVAMAVEGHSGDYSHVDGLVVCEQLSTWLHNPESPLL